jgi:hypothetical protein
MTSSCDNKTTILFVVPADFERMEYIAALSFFPLVPMFAPFVGIHVCMHRDMSRDPKS